MRNPATDSGDGGVPDLRRAAVFSAVLTVILTVLWRIAGHRDGSLDQPLTWDSAGFLADALEIKRAVEWRGLAGFWDAWVHTSRDHTTLVPALSALLMFVFGESRGAAELVLPLFTFVFVVSTVRAVQWLYRGANASAYATAALVSSFPVALQQQRIYLFEYPLAALVAASCWAMLTTERFTRTWPSVAFGAVSGLAALSRAGGPALLFGPVLVYVVASLRARDARPVKIRNLALAAFGAAAVAGPWYIPNLLPFLEYIWQVTYGTQATLYTGGESALTWENVKYTAQWYFVDGAGWPAVAVALYAYAHACVSRRRFVVSPTMVSLWLAFGLVFVPIVVVAQKAGGALLLSVMGIQALSIVRAVALVPRPRPRALLTLAVAACALHHVVAATFLFPPDQRRGGGLGPLERQGYPLWNHRNLYLDIVGPAQREPEYARRMDELADRIEILDEGRPVKDRPVIVSFNSDVAIFQVHNLRCEALLRRRAWSASSLIWMPPDAVEQQLAELRSQVLECDVLVKRTASPTGMNGYDKMVARVTGALVEGEPAPFVKWGDPIVIGNGEEYTLYVRDRAASLPR